eukprot:COSAG06_NODE_42942_length_377_cov_0.467626_1_plen_53_part_10
MVILRVYCCRPQLALPARPTSQHAVRILESRAEVLYSMDGGRVVATGERAAGP